MPSGGDGDVSGLELCEDLSFHGTDYIIEVSAADGQTLVVDVEQVGGGREVEPGGMQTEEGGKENPQHLLPSAGSGDRLS
jgi:hypothetical protein